MLSVGLKVAHNKLYLRPVSLWTSSPVEVYLLMPAPNAVWELLKLELETLGQSDGLELPVRPDGTGFVCKGVRFRTTAMPEVTGRSVIDVAREQDPQQANGQRNPVERIVFERLHATDPVTIAVDLTITVEAP
jgi:hypothetical protein